MPNTFSLSSTAFRHQEKVPTRFTCEGENVSPDLKWSHLPAGTQSLALIVEDPDAPDPKAPKRIWVHWILYNIPVSLDGFAAGMTQLPEGVLVGLNDWKEPEYGGPCPPVGRHRYFFNLYALDFVLKDLQQPTRAQLEEAMQGHVLAKAVLMGTYEKARAEAEVG